MAKRAKRDFDPTPEAYEFPVYPRGTLKLAEVDLSPRANRKTYGKDLDALQKKLFAQQIALFQEKRRAVVVFEGRDAAGKGGVIKRLTALMDPRGFKVWPIGAPRDEEARHHYLWRFWSRLPEQGELAVFDRSWYGRVLVERVDGLAKKAEWHRAYDELNAFERMLTSDGVKLIKFWLQVDKQTQLERFRAREADPVKRYKIGPDDWHNRKKWKAYSDAAQEMFDRTHRPDAPWVVIPANDKEYARLEVLRQVSALLAE